VRMPALLLLLSLAACGQNAAQQAEALWKQGRYKEAGAAFSAAVKADPKNPALRVRWGLLLLERFNPGEATDLFNEALQIEKDYAPAMLGLAKVYAEDFDQRAVGFVQKALEKDPELVEARELYANLLLEDGNAAGATAEALKIQASKNAMAVLATVELLKDQDASTWLTKMGPYAGGYSRIARHFVLNRRYEDAITYYRKAVEIDPGLHKAQSELGINLMRVGEDAEARRILEKAYEAGYTNAATANSLKLLDSYKNFIVYKQPRFILRLHKNEAALLRPYFEREMTRAMQTYDRKYGVKPGSVTLEVYPDHEDFAVRTMGMPGLGALGVTFGLSVAMDSPSARKPGSFHWASTLWHELSHVYVLTATKHRVPRWFTEGLAVHEETQADPEWGDRLGPEIITAMKKNMLLPVAQLDRGFIRPSYHGQVVVSYFQAGRICDYIQSRWGWDKLLAMVKAFSHVTTTAEVIESALGMKPEQFDKEFLEWLNQRHEQPLKNFETWSKAMKPLNEAVKNKSWDDVLGTAPKLITEYPDYVEAGNAYEALAEARIAKGDSSGACAVLEGYARHGGRDPVVLKKLASMYESNGNNKAAAERTLRRILWIYPVRDEELHRKLGALRASLGLWEGSAEEWNAVLESRTVDRAGAHYEIARAYRNMNRMDDARDAVLAALEEAPGYRPAQKLLLELNNTDLQKKE